MIHSAVKSCTSTTNQYLEYCSRTIARLAHGYFKGNTPTSSQRKNEQAFAQRLEGMLLAQINAEGMVMIFKNGTTVPLLHYTFACRLTYLHPVHPGYSFNATRKGDVLVMTSIERIQRNSTNS